tara:strand:- start:276 stop:728 length:453 start_codon:yes stop_codon:yes gene_type:complete
LGAYYYYYYYYYYNNYYYCFGRHLGCVHDAHAEQCGVYVEVRDGDREGDAHQQAAAAFVPCDLREVDVAVFLLQLGRSNDDRGSCGGSGPGRRVPCRVEGHAVAQLGRWRRGSLGRRHGGGRRGRAARHVSAALRLCRRVGTKRRVQAVA